MAKLNNTGVRKRSNSSYEINFWANEKHIYENIKVGSLSEAIAVRNERIQLVKSGSFIKRIDITLIDFYNIYSLQSYFSCFLN